MGMPENPLSDEPIKWDQDTALDELTEQLETSVRVDLGQIATPDRVGDSRSERRLWKSPEGDDQVDGESSVLLKVSYSDLSDGELGQSMHDRPLFRNSKE
jgi:hypothetical protein